MKTSLLLCICFFISICGIAQDTLYFKTSGKSVVIVKEVSQTEIQYKKFEVPDGPMYIVSKNDVEKIIYKNGYAEIIKPSVQQQPATNNTPFVVKYEAPPVNLEKITYEDTKRRYYTIVNLINRHPDPSRKNTLMDEAMGMKRMKKNQDGTRTMAIIFGGIAVGGTALYGLMYAESGPYDDAQIFAGPPIVFGIAAIAFGSASIAINMNLKSKRKAFVDLYNR